MPFDHFNLIAGIYAKTGKFLVEEPLIGLLSLSPEQRLLDAGGGTGRVSGALHSYVHEVVVVDTSPGMLMHARKNGMFSVEAPVERMPFCSGLFDRIIMVDAFHHVADQTQTIKELLRVLKPGGRIVIVEPDIYKTIVKVVALGEKVLLMRSHFLSGDKIHNLFLNASVKSRIIYNKHNVYVVADKDGN